AGWVLPLYPRGVKVLVHALGQHGRRERPVRLPELDLRIDDVLHLRAPRVRQDGPVTERARTPLEALLEPADHLPVGERLHRSVDQAVVRQLLVPYPLSVEEAADLALRVRLAPERVLHDELPRLAEQRVVGVEGRAHGAARIPG